MKVITFAAVLSLFVLAPVHTASAQATSTIDCSNESWTIRGDKARDIAVTVENPRSRLSLRPGSGSEG